MEADLGLTGGIAAVSEQRRIRDGTTHANRSVGGVTVVLALQTGVRIRPLRAAGTKVGAMPATRCSGRAGPVTSG